MKKINMKNFLIVLFLLSGFLYSEGKVSKYKNSPLPKVMLSEYKFLDGNTLNCTISSEGPYCDYRRTSNSGLEWPKGSGKTPVFTAGIWIGGVHRPTKMVRMSNMDYTPEYQPGPLLETYNTTTNRDDDPRARASDTKYRLYKINKKDFFGTTNKDFLEWPGDLGAPFEDVNGNGVWDKGTDKPKMIGDQQMWCVYNDVNVAKHNALSVTSPMGLEIQTTYFVFNMPGPLGDMMFMKWKIINKSDADYDSVFIGMWSDPDLGDANDDLPGVDTLLSLGYLYNGDNDDGTTHGYGAKPPAVGFDFFQGPKIISPNDSALYDGKWIKGFKNLPATSFVVYTNGTFPEMIDPPDGTPNYVGIAYDYLNGKAGTNRQYIQDANGKIVKFLFSGDPVKGTGQLPSTFKPFNREFSPQDVRVMINSGPFTLSKGDTQEIVGSIVLAQGSDRIQSVDQLRKVDDVAQRAFNKNFALPSAPDLPKIKVTELSDRIVFDWTENSSKTEGYDNIGYKFEGYNFYQGETQNGPWKRIFTYDKVDGITMVEDLEAHPVSGNMISVPVAFGEDSGIKYFFAAEKDYLTGNPLIAGKKYYFALTSYAYKFKDSIENAGLPKVLENSKEVIPGAEGRNYVTLQALSIGTDIPNSVGDLVALDREGDDNAKISVMNPLNLNGQSYRITFNGTDTNVTSWNLLRFGNAKSQNGFGSVDTLIKSSNDFSGGDFVKPTDGFIVKITKPSIGVRTDAQSPKGYDYTPSTNLWFAGVGNVGMEAFGGGVAYPGTKVFNSKGSKVKSDQLKKVEIRFNSGQKQKAFRFVGNLRKNAFTVNPLVDSTFIPFVNSQKIEVGYVYQNRVDVPFTVWEVDPLDGNTTARQLHVAFLEWNDTLKSKTTGAYVGKGNINGKWDPTTYSDGAKELLYIFSSTYDANDTNIYRQSKLLPNDPTKTIDLLAQQDSLDIYYILQVKAKSSSSAATNGDVFTIQPNYYINASRQYNFTTSKATVGNTELMKNQLDNIKVYPNPYFAHNKAESNPLQRFVSISHLPSKAKIRIISLTGEIIKTINYDSSVPSSNPSNVAKWDLRNENGLPVASGMYFIHVEIEGVGSKVLKLAVIQPEERSSRI